MIAKERIEELLIITTDLIEIRRANLRILEKNKLISISDFRRKLFEVNKAELRLKQIRVEHEREED